MCFKIVFNRELPKYYFFSDVLVERLTPDSPLLTRFLFCFSELSFTSTFPLRNYLGFYLVKFKKVDFIRRVLPT